MKKEKQLKLEKFFGGPSRTELKYHVTLFVDGIKRRKAVKTLTRNENETVSDFGKRAIESFDLCVKKYKESSESEVIKSATI